MILSQLSRHLEQQRRVALADLACRFGTSPDAVRGMLSVLERKGRVRKVALSGGCSSGCCKCDPVALEVYEWVNTELEH